MIMIYRAFYGGHWNSSSGPDLLFYAFGSFSFIGNKYATRGVVSHTCCVPLPTVPYQALIFLQLRFKENLSRYQNFKTAEGLPNPQAVFYG
ncbi:MAG: hypothetical protein ACFNL3_01265 [Rothia aeria]